MDKNIHNIKLLKQIIKAGKSKLVVVNETSTCTFKINFLDSSSNILQTNYFTDKNNETHKLSIGSASNLIDWAIEKFLLTMSINEECQCTIESDTKIKFDLLLIEATAGKYYFEMTLPEILETAQKYKENGLKCYKNYPWLAHDYFSKAAKCLLSYSSSTNFETQANTDSVSTAEISSLYETLSSNIAACLLKEERYKEVIEVLEFAVDKVSSNDKIIFRLVTAYIATKQYEQAKKTLEMNNFKSSQALLNLYNQLNVKIEAENEKYASMVKKMLPFS